MVFLITFSVCLTFDSRLFSRLAARTAKLPRKLKFGVCFNLKLYIKGQMQT